MKKVLLLTIIVILCVGLLSACQITYPDSESDSYFGKTMELLSAGDIKAAKELNCVDKGSTMEEQLQTVSEYLEGRTVTNHKKTSSEITNRYSTGGPETREMATYEVTLEDGTVLEIYTVYIDSMGMKGVSSFELQSN